MAEIQNKLLIDLVNNFAEGDALSFINNDGDWVDIPYYVVGAFNLGAIIFLGTLSIAMVILLGVEVITNGPGGILGAISRGAEVTGIGELALPIVEAIEGGVSGFSDKIPIRRQTNRLNANRRRRRR